MLAALTVWALLVPEALAYAGIAGVPPQYGLYAAPLALVAYALFGGSRHLIVGPSSTVAIVSAAVVAPLAASGGDQRYLALTIALALLTGGILVLAGLARLGLVAKFLAKPVLDGFIIGLAFTIAVGQAGKLVGVHLSGDTALQKTVSLFSQVGRVDLAAARRRRRQPRPAPRPGALPAQGAGGHRGRRPRHAPGLPARSGRPRPRRSSATSPAACPAGSSPA